MMPGIYDMPVYRGDTSRFRFDLWEDAGKTIPTDLTGATAKSEIRDSGNGAVPTPLTVTITLPNSINAIVPANAVLPGKGARPVWDLQVTWASGDVQTVVKGNVVLKGDVTDTVI